jgi:hypothetical protein
MTYTPSFKCLFSYSFTLLLSLALLSACAEPESHRDGTLSGTGESQGKELAQDDPSKLDKKELREAARAFKETMFEKLGEKDLLACEQSSDCILVEASVPCACESGGSQVVINKSFQKEWNNERSRLSAAFEAGFMCPMVMNCKDSSKIACIDNRCTLQNNPQSN